jgi:hypothetical protein
VWRLESGKKDLQSITLQTALEVKKKYFLEGFREPVLLPTSGASWERRGHKAPETGSEGEESD